MRSRCLRAPAKAMRDPSPRELLAFICQHHARTGRPVGLLEVLSALPHRDGKKVWASLVQLQSEGLIAQVPTLGFIRRWKPTGAGHLRCVSDATPKKNPAEDKSAGLDSNPIH